MKELQKVIDVVDDVLGAECIGAYLHGSSVAGGLRPASDLDVLLLVRRTMTQSERVVLLDGVLDVSGSRNNARPVELTVVVHSQIRPWRYPPIADFVYGEWLRADYEAGHLPLPQRMPDLALLITMALAGDRPLSGPRPAQVLPPVPPSDVVRASLAGMPDLVNSLDEDTRNVLLTFARIWCTLGHGPDPVEGLRCELGAGPRATRAPRRVGACSGPLPGLVVRRRELERLTPTRRAPVDRSHAGRN